MKIKELLLEEEFQGNEKMVKRAKVDKILELSWPIFICIGNFFCFIAIGWFIEAFLPLAMLAAAILYKLNDRDSRDMKLMENASELDREKVDKALQRQFEKLDKEYSIGYNRSYFDVFTFHSGNSMGGAMADSAFITLAITKRMRRFKYRLKAKSRIRRIQAFNYLLSKNNNFNY